MSKQFIVKLISTLSLSIFTEKISMNTLKRENFLINSKVHSLSEIL